LIPCFKTEIAKGKNTIFIPLFSGIFLYAQIRMWICGVFFWDLLFNKQLFEKNPLLLITLL